MRRVSAMVIMLGLGTLSLGASLGHGSGGGGGVYLPPFSFRARLSLGRNLRERVVEVDPRLDEGFTDEQHEPGQQQEHHDVKRGALERCSVDVSAPKADEPPA